MNPLRLLSCLCMAAAIVTTSAMAFPVSSQPATQQPATQQPEPKQAVTRRHPVSAVLLPEGRQLAVVNRRSGSLTLMDADGGTVQSETLLGGELSALAVWPGSGRVAITDYARHELILATIEGSDVHITQRLPVARYPVAVTISRTGTSVAVASLWSRRLTVLDISRPAASDAPGAQRVLNSSTLNLPFAPHAILFTESDTLIASEAFGGRIGICFPDTRAVQTRQFAVHNIRDLAIRDGQLWFSHQLLRDTARTEEEHIHWGILLENFVSSIPLKALLEPPQAARHPLDRIRIGDAGNGAGDPGGISILENRIAVTLAGTSQLALIDRVGVREMRLPTGSRPQDVVCDERRQRAYVLNSLSDSITVIDLQETTVLQTVSLGPGPEPGPVDRGEAAFYDARLSLENWMSCHSCHTDGHTSNRLADTPGDGGFGNSKRIPSVLGTAGTGPWGWTGTRQTLEQQIEKTLTTTMHTGRIPDRLVADLSAYLRSQETPPSLATARRQLQSDRATSLIPATQREGQALFRRAGCVECHSGPQLTARAVFDVDLEDQTGLRLFNPPSLLGVSQRDRLLHDGRAATPDALLSIHPPGLRLSAHERQLLLAYLSSL